MSTETVTVKQVPCKHNQRCRYTSGFRCEDCGNFFSKDSPTYRSGELLSSLWMVLWNINVDRCRKDEPRDAEVDAMCEKIGIGQVHEDYESLIVEAEVILRKHGYTSESATVVLK